MAAEVALENLSNGWYFKMVQNAVKRFEITGTGLKTIAVVTMLIDHIAAGFLLYWLNQQTDVDVFNHYRTVYMVMRCIGRMAFPIYCYMLVEGFLHTSNLKKYVQRILTMAVVSELPFDLALRWKLIDWTHNNVMWELALGLIVLLAIHSVLYKTEDAIKDERLRRILAAAIMLAGMGIGHLLQLDYSEGGIACISVMYFLYGVTKEQRLTSFGMGVLMLALMSGNIEVFAFIMLIPFFFYDGKRGRDSKFLRVFFYTFYPVHLIIIYIARLILL